MGSGRVEPLDALYRAVELVFREDGVRVIDFVHVWKAWCMVKKGWVWLRLDMVVYLNGGAASVLPCIESFFFRKNRFNLAEKGLKATQVHNSDTPILSHRDWWGSGQ